jgi:2-polyprenyl-6-hydroxyphenyl methylase/3-demethylubiquinone-9 3-methyltransferase
LGLLTAAAAGARVVGVDINATCAEVLSHNQRFFDTLVGIDIPVVIGSVLDPHLIEKARRAGPENGRFDVVHSWGVLHHTGNMQKAICNAADLVAPGGYFVIALYNRHWSSPIWRIIKYTYCKSPRFVQRTLVAALFPVIYVAKWIVTRQNPRHQARGMDFFYDVVDWVGGYPYEYASRSEVLEIIEPLGFACVQFTPAQVPTGCNEFVFRRDGVPTRNEARSTCSGDGRIHSEESSYSLEGDGYHDEEIRLLNGKSR